MGFLTVRGHTGFDRSDPASMACKKGLELIERAVRKQPDFMKIFPLTLSKNNAVSKNGFKMVGSFTGSAGEREASRASDAKASSTTFTAKSSVTSAFLGEDAQKMNGVVFRLQTGIDNSNGGVCVWMNGVTNRLPQNTVLRLLSEQVREIDMAK